MYVIVSIKFLVFGWLADKVKRKYLMCIGSLFTATGCAIVAFFTNFNIFVFAGVFIGIGVGCCDAVYLGLLLDIIDVNTPTQKAQNMALFNTVTQVLPKILASFIGGATIAIGNALSDNNLVPIAHFGYNCLMGVSSAFCIVGSMFLLFISSKYQNSSKDAKK